MKHPTTIPPKARSRNVCAPSTALHLRLARVKAEAAVIALQRAEEGDPTLRYALNATRSDAQTLIDHIDLLIREVAR